MPELSNERLAEMIYRAQYQSELNHADISSALTELQQRRASVVTPEEFTASCPTCRGTGDHCGNPDFGQCDDCGGTGYLAALSVVSHETGDGETEAMWERCPECNLNWGLNPPAKVYGSDHVRCIECKSLFPAPTDETQGVKREAIDRFGWTAAPGGGLICIPNDDGYWVKYHDHIAQLEAVERERDGLRIGCDRGEAQWKFWEARAETAEASLAAMTVERDDAREALAECARRFDNIRGAIESNQVVDKDVHGTAVRGRDMARATLSAGAPS